MVDRKDYAFTHHLRERYLERTRNKYKHLRICRKDSCERCRNLIMDIKEELADRRKIDLEIASRINQAIECRAYLNDSEFMSWYYKKYGTDQRFEFLADKDICFVVVHGGNRKVVVTCVYTKNNLTTRQILRPKFRKKKNAEIYY